MSETFVKTQLVTIINNLKQYQSALKGIANDNNDEDEEIVKLKQEITKTEHMLKNVKKQIGAIYSIEINHLVKQADRIIDNIWNDITWNRYQSLPEIKPVIIRRAKNEYCKILKDINNQINEITESISADNLQSSLEQLYNNYAYFKQVNDNYQDIFHSDFDGKLNMFKKNTFHNFNDLYLEIRLRWGRNDEKPDSLESHYKKTYTITS